MIDWRSALWLAFCRGWCKHCPIWTIWISAPPFWIAWYLHRIFNGTTPKINYRYHTMVAHLSILPSHVHRLTWLVAYLDSEDVFICLLQLTTTFIMWQRPKFVFYYWNSFQNMNHGLLIEFYKYSMWPGSKVLPYTIGHISAIDSKMQSTHDSSSIVRSSMKIVSGKASEFCSLRSKIDRAQWSLEHKGCRNFSSNDCNPRLGTWGYNCCV